MVKAIAFPVVTYNVLQSVGSQRAGHAWVTEQQLWQWKASRVVQWLRICLQCRSHRTHGFNPWVRKSLWREAWESIPMFLPGEPHRQRSLAGFSPWFYRVRHDWSNSMLAWRWKVSRRCKKRCLMALTADLSIHYELIIFSHILGFPCGFLFFQKRNKNRSCRMASGGRYVSLPSVHLWNPRRVYSHLELRKPYKSKDNSCGIRHIQLWGIILIHLL